MNVMFIEQYILNKINYDIVHRIRIKKLGKLKIKLRIKLTIKF